MPIMRHTPRQTPAPNPPPEPRPILTALAAEIGCTADELAARLGADVPIVPPDPNWLARMNAAPHPIDRVAAIQRAQAEMLRAGVGPDDGLVLIGEAADRGAGGRSGDRRADVLNEMLRGQGSGRRFRIRHDQ